MGKDRIDEKRYNRIIDFNRIIDLKRDEERKRENTGRGTLTFLLEDIIPIARADARADAGVDMRRDIVRSFMISSKHLI